MWDRVAKKGYSNSNSYSELTRDAFQVIYVFDFSVSPPLLVRKHGVKEIPKAEQSPIVKLEFGLDGRRQLVSCDGNGVVRVYSTMGKRPYTDSYDRAMFPTQGSKFEPLPLQLRALYQADDMKRKKIELKGKKKKKAKSTSLFAGFFSAADEDEEKEESIEDLKPIVSTFHPSVSLLGINTSLMLVGLELASPLITSQLETNRTDTPTGT